MTAEKILEKAAVQLPPTEDSLLDEHEFSALVGIPVQTLRRHRSDPDAKDPVPYIKRGRSVYYTMRLWKKYLERLTVDPRNRR